MSRPRLTSEPAAIVRPVARVARVMELLDCEESDVRRLIDSGDLEAHGIGRRGVRVYLDSVADYQASKSRAPKSPVDKRHKPRPAARAAQISAENELRESGILP